MGVEMKGELLNPNPKSLLWSSTLKIESGSESEFEEGFINKDIDGV